MKRRLQKNIYAILLAVFLVGVSACGGQKNEIDSLLEDFELSCNKLDLNGMLNCFDPEITQSIKFASSIVGTFTDENTDEVLEEVAVVLINELPDDTKKFFSSIQICNEEIMFDEDKAIASAYIKYDIADEEYNEEAEIEYLYINNRWYISNISFE